MDHDQSHPKLSTAESGTQASHNLTLPASRYYAMDVLRGFALLGILVPNVWFFAWPMAAGTIPERVLSDSSANRIAHDITSVVFLGKFMFLFALLFGAGVVIYAKKFEPQATQTDSAETRLTNIKLTTGASLWYMRCFTLLIFGMLHAYLFWYGDILTLYAVAGLTLLWWVRRLDPRIQLWGGLGLYFLGALLMLALTALGYIAYQQGHVTLEELTGGDTTHEIKGYQGGFISAFTTRFLTTLMMQIFFGILFMPALWGIMTMGMGLTRLGILTGERAFGFYLKAAFVLLPLGALLTVALYILTNRFGEVSGYIWQGTSQLIGVPLSLGYGAIIIAFAKARAARLLTYPLACVGRMALSNYFAHTLLCTTFFYGYGLGYFAKIEYPALWLIVLVVWAFNIIFSMLWLRAFKMGPFEWIWRCVTYMRLVPIR